MDGNPHYYLEITTMTFIAICTIILFVFLLITALIERAANLALIRKFKRRAIRYYFQNPDISQERYNYYAQMERKTRLWD